MAIDPRDTVNAAGARSRAALADPPRFLVRSPEAPEPLADIRHAPELAEMHRRWAQLHSSPGAGAETPPGATRVQTKVRARVVTAAAGLTRQARAEDRALAGDLIRAIDLVAGRTDELSARVDALAQLVHEVVVVLTEDLAAVRAALSAAGPQAGDDSPKPAGLD